MTLYLWVSRNEIFICSPNIYVSESDLTITLIHFLGKFNINFFHLVFFSYDLTTGYKEDIKYLFLGADITQLNVWHIFIKLAWLYLWSQRHVYYANIKIDVFLLMEHAASTIAWWNTSLIISNAHYTSEWRKKTINMMTFTSLQSSAFCLLPWYWWLIMFT